MERSVRPWKRTPSVALGVPKRASNASAKARLPTPPVRISVASTSKRKTRTLLSGRRAARSARGSALGIAEEEVRGLRELRAVLLAQRRDPFAEAQLLVLGAEVLGDVVAHRLEGLRELRLHLFVAAHVVAVR